MDDNSLLRAIKLSIAGKDIDISQLEGFMVFTQPKGDAPSDMTGSFVEDTPVFIIDLTITNGLRLAEATNNDELRRILLHVQGALNEALDKEGWGLEVEPISHTGRITNR